MILGKLNNDRLVMELGERRKIGINVFSQNGDNFMLQSVKVSLYRLKKGMVELETECDASFDQTNIYTEIEPKTAGFYLLKVEMEIADEQIIKKFNIAVNW